MGSVELCGQAVQGSEQGKGEQLNMVLQIVIVVVGQSKSGHGFVAMMVVKKAMVGQRYYFAQGEGETEDKQLYDGGAHQLSQTQQEELDCSLSGHNFFRN